MNAVTRSRSACTFGEYAKSMGRYLLDQNVDVVTRMLENLQSFI
ncbi:hypothetical protein ALQ33_100932 [Pseudomonas syringae pv. philadelphi]|uniref:Uncharacterized protein n=2 Tax=Pseudomonas syringae group TaxID=136849 RepID=A0A3M3QF24_PSECA|nr:hypothetical protein ALO83_101853 [Pseudomonas cannabina pv. alisalensis]RMN77192.1 hypothetical protein ALQ52_102267 [Pseudomonas cannabina pv. alisalensis]RMN82774.1 hypothetical protein ALQ53_101782 [Pseudomonas cannabina]RMN88572.1 hypothetical protein ALQ51_101026 [Pseudomonas cannabina]RMO94566.1 hypothetical protein ALQ33_100932 [Pseudomonas syringae pv. philadelphi]